MSRETILKSIKQNKPNLLPLPEIDLDKFQEDLNLLASFKEKVALVGGNIIELDSAKEIDTEIQKRYPKAKDIVTCTQKSSLETVSISEKTNPHTMASIDLAIIEGDFGVVENGAIWITENEFPIRVLPFITNDLVIVLDKEKLCTNLHEAYKLIANRDRNFGLFIAGPSKTADIEQCLVIGAQGAMSLTILLI
ncbi:LUD domain-containing protein [Lutibacter sp. A80]|uniref:LutC/YkgG family protein n=1 Tax=Lutibacter sp. A80 TaxID=2918453 RepID=UPI001F070504|nr:LUD domain-containing protein [Lutibacter sp. A80]UMB59183.1 LUD domain-containing protein [Lutibacter sp. A80]